MNLTAEAKAKLETLRPRPESILRISVIGGGCSGLTYQMHWVDTIEPEADIHVTTDGPIIYALDGKSKIYLSETTLHYSDGLNGKGFEFNNPKAKRTCGCGSSFST